MLGTPDPRQVLRRPTVRLARTLGALPRFPLQQRAIRRLAPPGALSGTHVVCKTAVGDLHLTPEDHIDWHMYFLHRYESEIGAVIQRFLRPGDLGVDVGANIGVFTLMMCRAVQAAGAVVAAEPSERNFARLEENVRLNHLENVQIHRVALSDHVGQISFFEPADRHNSGLASTLRHGHLAAGPTVVPGTTLDRLIGRRRVALVKVDVEGGELRVLQGAGETIERDSPAVVFEFDPTLLATAGHTWRDLVAAFPSGYSFKILRGRRVLVAPSAGPHQSCNVLATSS